MAKKWWNVTYSKCGDLTVLADSAEDAEKAADDQWMKGERPEWTNAEITYTQPADDDEQEDRWATYLDDEIDRLDRTRFGSPTAQSLLDYLASPITENFEFDGVEHDAFAMLGEFMDMWAFSTKFLRKYALTSTKTFAKFVVDRQFNYGEKGTRLDDFEMTLRDSISTDDIASVVFDVKETYGTFTRKYAKDVLDIVKRKFGELDHDETDAITKAEDEIANFDEPGTSGTYVYSQDWQPLAMAPIEAMYAIIEHRKSIKETNDD